MKNAAMILGIIGGILGMALSALAIMIGLAFRFITQVFPPTIDFPFPFDRLFPFIGMLAVTRGVLALACSIIALSVATLVKRSSSIPGIVLLISGIAGFFILYIGFLVPGVLLILGGAFALSDREKTALQPVSSRHDQASP